MAKLMRTRTVHKSTPQKYRLAYAWLFNLLVLIFNEQHYIDCIALARAQTKTYSLIARVLWIFNGLAIAISERLKRKFIYMLRKFNIDHTFCFSCSFILSLARSSFFYFGVCTFSSLLLLDAQ